VFVVFTDSFVSSECCEKQNISIRKVADIFDFRFIELIKFDTYLLSKISVLDSISP
jgi:hypothetical protein